MTRSLLSKTEFSKILKIESSIGNTHLLKIKNVYQKKNISIYAKLEWQQLGGSIKARPAFNIIKSALLNDKLNSNIPLIDATSGNTGIAYAAIASALGLKIKLALPENASRERKEILKSYGAELILTSKFEGTDGAQNVVKEIIEKHPEYYYADQYSNNLNWLSHYNTTALEIIQQTDGRITHFVNGLGTTGTFMGTTRRLKEFNPKIKAISLQPNNPLHGLEGWKHLETAKVPKIYHPNIADENLEIDTLNAYQFIKKAANKEGLFLSPSAAANLWGAIQVAERIDEGVIVTTFADDASKYTEVLRKLID